MKHLTLRQIKNIIDKLPIRVIQEDCKDFHCALIHEKEVINISKEGLYSLFKERVR